MKQPPSPTMIVLPGVVAITLLAGCGERAPCEDILESGPRVSLADAFAGCNHAPSAVIGGPRLVGKRIMVPLDGTTSVDPEGEPLSFRWSLVERPATSEAMIADASAESTSFTPDVAGTYRIELVVNDGELDSPTAIAIITSSNRVPVASAGSNQQVQVGETAQLDGSQSQDPDGDPLTFSWSIVQAPPGSTASIEDPTATGPRLRTDLRGVFELRLVVNDGETDSAPAMVRVGAGISANPPIADAGPSQLITVGESVTLSAHRSSDVDGDPLTFSWALVSPPGLATLSSTSGVQTTLVPDVMGTWAVELTVDDGFYRVTDQVMVSVGRADRLTGPSVFDPNEMYVVGTLSEGAAYLDLFCDLKSPNRPSAGFPSSHPGGQLHPIDGTYHYIDSPPASSGGTVRRFVADALTWDEEFEAWVYPSNPAGNDPAVSTPLCPNSVTSFLFRPTTGALIYVCEQGTDWHDIAGNVVPACDFASSWPLSLGYDGSVLCDFDVRDSSGTLNRIEPFGDNGVSRAHPDGGFWIVRENRVSGLFERHRLDPDGTLTLELSYPPVPSGYNIVNATVLRWANLDSEGNLYRWVYGESPLDGDKIMLLPADGTSPRIVYDEASDPLCKLHGFRLVSGR